MFRICIGIGLAIPVNTPTDDINLCPGGYMSDNCPGGHHKFINYVLGGGGGGCVTVVRSWGVVWLHHCPRECV